MLRVKRVKKNIYLSHVPFAHLKEKEIKFYFILEHVGPVKRQRRKIFLFDWILGFPQLAGVNGLKFLCYCRSNFSLPVAGPKFHVVDQNWTRFDLH